MLPAAHPGAASTRPTLPLPAAAGGPPSLLPLATPQHASKGRTCIVTALRRPGGWREGRGWALGMLLRPPPERRQCHTPPQGQGHSPYGHTCHPVCRACTCTPPQCGSPLSSRASSAGARHLLHSHAASPQATPPVSCPGTLAHSRARTGLGIPWEAHAWRVGSGMTHWGSVAGLRGPTPPG